MFEKALATYKSRDYVTAVVLFDQCIEKGEVVGRAQHLKGNSLMQLGRLEEAAKAYKAALADSAYEKVGAVATNLGKAYIGLGQYDDAIEQFHKAVEDQNYKTPYKAYSALGGAYLKKNKPREAGIAYRKAALDQTNPNPFRALMNLGLCFMELDRPADAVEAYRAALEFNMSPIERSMLYSNMGQAFYAQSRIDDAYDSFMTAIDSGQFRLAPAAQRDFEAVREARAAQKRASSSLGGTEEFLMNAGALMTDTGSAVMPSPDDSGFFDATEQELIAQSKLMSKAERKHKRTGLKIFIAFLLILVLIAGGLAYAYISGYGYPMQETVIKQLFSSHSRGEDTSEYWSINLPSDVIEYDMRDMAKTNAVTVDGIDRDTMTSKARVTASLAEGGSVTYYVDLIREGIGWKVSGVDLVFDSQLDAPEPGTEGASVETSSPEDVDAEDDLDNLEPAEPITNMANEAEN